MSKDGHFSSDAHGPKSSLEPFPERQLKLCVTWSWVHAMVLKANWVSRAALGGHRQPRGGAGKEMSHASWELSPFVAPVSLSRWFLLLPHLRPMPTNQSDAATALNQQPPLQLRRDRLVFALHVHPTGLHGGIWSNLGWDRPYSDCVAHMNPPQSHERLSGSAVGLSWELLKGRVSTVCVKICSDIPQR